MYNRKYIILFLVSILIVVGHYQYVCYVLNSSSTQNEFEHRVNGMQIKGEKILNYFYNVKGDDLQNTVLVNELNTLYEQLHALQSPVESSDFEQVKIHALSQIEALTNRALKAETKNDVLYVQNIQHDIYESLNKIIANSRTTYNDTKNNFENVELIITIISIVFIILSLLFFTEPLLNELKLKNTVLQDSIFTLQKRNKEVSEFSYVISHDLQEPISTIESVLHSKDLDLAKTKEVVNTQVDILNSLIKDLSLYHQSSVKTKNSVCNLRRSIKSNLKLLDISKNCQIYMERDVELSMDCTDLNLLLHNLLKNCFDFKKVDVALDVKIFGKKQDGFYELTVEDNGKGIPKKLLPQIRNIFISSKSDNAFNNYVGLGLAISSKIVSDYNGNFSIESNIGKGTKVKVTLPLAKHSL